MEAGDLDDSLYCSTRTMGRRTIDTSQWASPDEGALDGRRRALFRERKRSRCIFPVRRPTQSSGLLHLAQNRPIV